jgi:2-iminobutanoate/2-iminopropanoate deaminase
MTEFQVISTPDSPAAIGPYSQALVCEGWIYASGQIPLDPHSGEVLQGDVAAQTDLALKNMAAVLEAAGGGLQTVIKTTVYLSDMAHFAEMNARYAVHFGDHRPARVTIQAAELPRGVDVEIDAVARVRS